MDSAGGDHSGYRLCYGILIAVALAAVMLALSVPAARERHRAWRGEFDGGSKIVAVREA